MLYHGYELFLYVVPSDCVGCGSNLTIECMHRSLDELRKRLGDQMPRTWNVQMDSAGDNKCKFVFAYFAHCVAVGGVTDIEVNFLMVGHTHEDIDGTCASLFFRLQLPIANCRSWLTVGCVLLIIDIVQCHDCMRSGILCHIPEAQSGPRISRSDARRALYGDPRRIHPSENGQCSLVLSRSGSVLCWVSTNLPMCVCRTPVGSRPGGARDGVGRRCHLGLGILLPRISGQGVCLHQGLLLLSRSTQHASTMWCVPTLQGVVGVPGVATRGRRPWSTGMLGPGIRSRTVAGSWAAQVLTKIPEARQLPYAAGPKETWATHKVLANATMRCVPTHHTPHTMHAHATHVTPHTNVPHTTQAPQHVANLCARHMRVYKAR